MSGHKRRQYPQAQYQAAAAVTPPLQMAADPAANGYYAGEQQPAYGVDAAVQGMGNLNINPAATVPVQPAYGGVVPPQAQPAYTGSPYDQQQQYQQQYQQPYQQQQQQQSLPLNQLYQTDLLRELPPPINDLSFPPPPLVIPSNISAIPNNPHANENTEFVRCTLNAIPTTHSLLKKSKLPLALILRPYNTLTDDVRPVPVVEDTNVSRCSRCRTYINPFVAFNSQNQKWRCNLCQLNNDVPAFFDFNKDLGVSVNRYDRKELNYSVVEFRAPPQYMARPPQPLVYCFIIDVSQQAIQTGLLATVANTILESIDRIPNKDGRTRISIIGVDSALHYFKIPEDEDDDETSILVVPDLDEPFSPSPDSLLVNVTNAKKNIEKLLTNISDLFVTTTNPNFALGPALKFAHHLVQNIGAKIVAFGSTLPNVGIGKLVPRDEAKFSNTAKEASGLLTPNDSFYKSFAVDCYKSQVTIEFFLTGARYQDVATLSVLPRYTAGQTHYYPSWNGANYEDVVKLSKELTKTITQDIALEAVLRTRGSSGLRMNNFYGNFFSRSSDLCSFSTFPRDQGYVIEVSLEENLTKPIVYFQSAVLHTTTFGERRIRVLTVAIPTTSNIAEVFASADQLAIANYYTHKAIEKVYSNSLGDARELLTKYLIDILNVFKKEVVSSNVSGSSPLMFSTNLRMLPLLLHALIKHLGFRPGKVPSDHRANALNLLGSLPLPHLIKYIYPSVYSLHDIPDDVGTFNEETGEVILPTPINATAELFQKYGLYLIDNGSELFLWIGGDAVEELVFDVFGVNDIFQIPTGKFELPQLESEFNTKVRTIISKIREGDDRVTYQNLYIVRGGSANEPLNAVNAAEIASLRLWAASNLIEDRIGGQESYREFLASTKDKISN